MKPTVGRIVHFLNARGITLAGIITRVHVTPEAETGNELVDLALFVPELYDGPYDGPCVAARGVPYSEELELNHWTFPPRVRDG